MYFGGIEGGATHSNLVICDETGTVRGKSKGPGTNHWAIGIDECAKRVLNMVNAAKEDAGISKDKPLNSLGLTLSGCAQDSSNEELAAKVLEMDNDCAKAIYVATDTAGSLFTGAPNGGMVVIAGTGSNSLLRTLEGKLHGCGGWGYLLGDEGGAYWIAHRAVKKVFDDIDGLRLSPHPIERVWDAVKEHFNVDNRDDLLPHAYKNFQKPEFAGLAKKLSALAFSGDDLSRHLFAEAGSALAAHVGALAQRAVAAKLRVVCVGSVWNSWDILKPGFLNELASRGCNTELELVRLRVSSAMGAAWLAAKHVNYLLPRDDSAYCQIFYRYEPNNTLNKQYGTSENHSDENACLNKSDVSHENGVSQENGTSQGNSSSRSNGTSNGNCYSNGKLNGNHKEETCGCTDWRNWS